MYLKLSLRNIKRSMMDYLLYISSMVMLTSVICFSNCIANWGNMQAGFQTMALPLLTVMIMATLANYINHFIVRQRAKEFATYMLLGMEKDKLSFVFLCELSAIGLICFLLGITFGAGIFSVFCCTLLQGDRNRSMLQIISKSASQTFICFCCVEILSAFFMKRNIYDLQIVQLMKEKQRNQTLGADQKVFWKRLFLTSFLCYLALLSGISFLPDKILYASVSLISLPMLVCIFSFYKWLYAFTASLRLSQADALYRGNRLYQIAEMTNASKTDAIQNSIFCTCFIFSAASFVAGSFLLNPDLYLFEQAEQQWMGFLQVSICMIFMVIYYSILSFLQITDLKRASRNMLLLFHLGKNPSGLKHLIRAQILVKLLIPTFMSLILLGVAAPLVNYKLNTVLPIHNYLPKALGCFMACFFVLYLCYFGVIYTVTMRHIKLKNCRNR